MNWSDTEVHAEILRFTRLIIDFRKRHQIVRLWRYMTKDETETPILRNITWHGVKPDQPDWSEGSRFLAWVLEAFKTEQRGDVPIYVGTNSYWEPIEIELPTLKTGHWYRVVDTSLPVGEDIVPDEEAYFLPETKYLIRPRSTIVLVSR
jgi:glycogen operon protein